MWFPVTVTRAGQWAGPEGAAASGVLGQGPRGRPDRSPSRSRFAPGGGDGTSGVDLPGGGDGAPPSPSPICRGRGRFRVPVSGLLKSG